MKLFFLVLGLALASLAPAQTQNVSQRVFNARTPTAGVSGTIRNIGQSQHLIWLQFTDSGGSCGATSAQVWLEASYDGSLYFPLTMRELQLDESKVALAVANGTFPSLRLNSAQNWSNCALTVYYSGSIQTAAYPQTPRAIATGYLLGSTSASSTTATLVKSGQSSGRIVVYGIWAHNAGAAQSATLFYGSDATCTVNSGTIAPMNLPLGAAPVLFPASVVPYAAGPAGASLCWSLGGAGNATVYAIYRME